MAKDQSLKIGAWALVTAVSVAAIVAWGQDYNWKFLPINSYQLFPLLGLLAFSIMWSHYVSGTIRELVGASPKALATYFRYSGYAVLTLISLHPGLLIYQRFRDGAGLPPGSYESYVAPGLAWVTVLGTASLLVFLAFEFRRFFSDRSWWHFIPEAGDFAMLAIFYHGLRLGGQLQGEGWYQTVWLFYGIVLAAIVVRSYFIKYGPGSKKARV